LGAHEPWTDGIEKNLECPVIFFLGSMGNDKGTLRNQREKSFAQDIVQASKLKARWKISIYAIFT